MTLKLFIMATVSIGCAGTAMSQTPPVAAECNKPAAEAIVQLAVPGNPFTAIPTRDGCWIFTSLSRAGGGQSGVAVLKRDNGMVSLSRVVSIAGAPTGMVLTHDEQTLIVADGDRVAFLNVGNLISGRGDAVLGYMSKRVRYRHSVRCRH